MSNRPAQESFTAREVALRVLERARAVAGDALAKGEIWQGKKELGPAPGDKKMPDRVEAAPIEGSREERRTYDVQDSPDKETGKASEDNTRPVEGAPDAFVARPLKKFMGDIVRKRAAR